MSPARIAVAVAAALFGLLAMSAASDHPALLWLATVIPPGLVLWAMERAERRAR